MDMKKILSAFDNATTTPKVGTSDMKKFMSIVNESAVAKESVVSFDEDSIGGDVNDFLIAADHINDLVMGNLDKIKINANEQLLKEVMSKFNEFMTAYHAVGKEILQPDLFDSVDNEQVDEAGYRGRRDAYQRDYDSSVSGMGKRDSLAYRMDGGANDEGEVDEPRQQRPAVAPSRGMYFYNVPAGKENDARIYGLKQTKSGKWYSKTKSSILDKVYGPGRYWEPKSEGVAEGSGPKEKQKTPYRDINSPEYRAAADKQKQRMDKDKAAEPGKKMLSKQGVAEGSEEYCDEGLGLSIKDYFALEEAKQKGVDGKACWDGYKRVGTKQKGGKTVDNCVPTGKK
jgi:hypothetical protein